MSIFHKKTSKQKSVFHYSFIVVGILALLVSSLAVMSLASQTISPDSIQFEQLVIARIAWFKFKLAAGLLGAGSLVAYLLCLSFVNSPLGEASVTWSDSDSNEVKASKNRNLGLIYSALIIGVFLILSSILGK